METAAPPQPGRLRRGAGATFASLGYRNFRLFFTGQLISQVGNWLTLVAQTLLALKITDSGIAVGALAACQFAPVLLFGAWTGLIADRSDKRKLLLIVQTCAMAQSFALAALASMHKPPLAGLFAIAFCGGLATAFDNPARRAFVVEMVPETSVQNAVSLNSALMTSSRIFGPALAGLLVATVGFSWCFAVDGFSYIAVLIGLAMMRPAELRRPPVTPKHKGQVREGLRYVKTVPDLWIPLAMMLLVGTLAFNFQVVMPLFARRSLGGGDNLFTLLYSTISVGSFVGALITARRTVVGIPHVISAAAFFGVSLLLFAAAPNAAFAFPLGILVGGSSIAFMTASTAIVQMKADPAMRGRVLALQAMVFLGSTPIGGPILGAICDAVSPRAGFALGGVACLVAAAGGYALHRRIVLTPAAAALQVAPS